MQETWQVSLKKQLMDTYVQSPQEWTDINISTSGLLNLTIISDRFEELSLPQRKEQLQGILRQFKISPGFISLYTVEESRSLNLSAPQLVNGSSINTWQDLALWAANPQNQSQLSQPEPRIPRTVTFYSFKGGVGRTTALTHVAWILAMRGRKVVAVDLDLEAPGLSTAFSLNPLPEFGIVDYFYERSYLPEGLEPNILITKIFGEVTIPNATGRLFIVPAGSLSLDYISKVDDLRATTILDNGETLWSIFNREIQEQLKPDIILVDSRTGINEWGALSLLQAADEAIIFLFPNEQNRQGIDLLLKSLNSFGKLSINFVFSPLPDLSDIGMAKVRKIWQVLHEVIERETDKEKDQLSENGDDSDESPSEIAEPLVVPYLQPIALADHYPVTGLLDYYNRIANLIDEDTNQIRLGEILPGRDSDERWKIIESLQFPALNAADPSSNLIELFQKTANFDKFLDETTCLIRGRKGTGKTALYLLLLKHESKAKLLARGRLNSVTFLAGHGTFQNSRPSRDEFQIINRELEENQGSWEALWRAYLILRVFQSKHLSFSKKNKEAKFDNLRDILNKLPGENWQYEHTQALIQLSTDPGLRLLIKDALDILNEQQSFKNQTLWLLYDDLDEDFPERDGVRQQALTGLFQLIQACDARRLTSIRFKIFLREDIWNRLNFDNKSHFNGRDLFLKWTRVDFLRLALRQAMQSQDFKNLVDRSSPVENIDNASEETLNRALDLLWGIYRRTGKKAKYVYRWVYERLSDLNGTAFPRSLSALLQGAKEHELTYKGETSVKAPTDRLLRGKSLEIGLEKASEERCDAIKQEYPDLCQFFDALEGVPALPTREELEKAWQKSARQIYSEFDEFANFLSEIGLAKWRDKEQRYGFADIYVYGFKMERRGGK